VCRRTMRLIAKSLVGHVQHGVGRLRLLVPPHATDLRAGQNVKVPSSRQGGFDERWDGPLDRTLLQTVVATKQAR
jgi:hypothetical protein